MTLTLIQGGSPEDPGRGGTRRTVRRRPPGRDPVTEVLEHLDEEPAEDRPGRTTAALLLVLCAALAAGGYLGFGWLGDRQTDRAHRQATAAATRACVDFVSVSAASVDRDLQRILAGTTGDLRDEFSRGRSQVRAAVVANNVESRGDVLRAALLTGDRRRATVFVAIDATVRTTDAPDGRRSHHRIEVQLERPDDRWLVSRLRFGG